MNSIYLKWKSFVFIVMFQTKRKQSCCFLKKNLQGCSHVDERDEIFSCRLKIVRNPAFWLGVGRSLHRSGMVNDRGIVLVFVSCTGSTSPKLVLSFIATRAFPETQWHGTQPSLRLADSRPSAGFCDTEQSGRIHKQHTTTSMECPNLPGSPSSSSSTP